MKIAFHRKKLPAKAKTAAKLILKAFLIFFCITVVWVLVYKYVNPPATFLMLQRSVSSDKALKIEKKWCNYNAVPLNVHKAIVASEDSSFFKHSGFNFLAIKNAYYHNRAHGTSRGASTVSQQTAKNVFLWPGKNWLRKGLEAYFTILIEFLWGKKRIMEVYLNVIETGNMIFGIEMASQKYFRKSASELNDWQAAMIISILPNPRELTLEKNRQKTHEKTRLILRRMKKSEVPLL